MSSKVSIEPALTPGLPPVLRVETGSRQSGSHLLRLMGCRFKYLLLCAAVKHERKSLARLTDRELQDIGIDRVDAVRECKRKNSLWNQRSSEMPSIP